MFYCPKCQQTYDEGAQRFCSNDGVRLLPAPSSGKSVNQSNGVFTNLLGRAAPRNENDEKLSLTPKFVKVETIEFVQTKSLPTSKVFSTRKQYMILKQNRHLSLRNLCRELLNYEEIPTSQAKLGDRKINLTRENTDILLGQTVKGRYRITKTLDKDDSERCLSG